MQIVREIPRNREIILTLGLVILIQLFIAVINEGFAVAEDEKHKQQLERFVKRSQAKTEAPSWMDKMNPYNYVKARPKALAPGTLPANLALPLRKAVVRDLANDGSEVVRFACLVRICS